MRRWLGLELARSLRDLRYVALAVVAPVGFYLLFAGIFSGRGTSAGQLPAQVEIMVAMAAFGAMWGALSATAPRLARDAETGWLRALKLTPVPPGRIMAARVASGMIAALPALIAVGATAAAVHGVRLGAWQWAAGLGLLWVGTIPFVALGIAIGATTSSTTAYALSSAAWFALGALGGLWVPPAQFSPVLRDVARALPSYEQADLAWRVAAGAAPSPGDAVSLAAWAVTLTGLAALLTARSGRRRHATSHTETTGPSAVSLYGITKRYGELQAVDHLDLDVPAGATVAILGPNGAGKSTTIEILLGLRDPDEGATSLAGMAPARAIATGRVGAMLQDGQLMAGVKVAALLDAVRAAYPKPANLTDLAAEAGITDLLARRSDQLSIGQAQRVRFALAAAGDPDILVLDEPTVAMDVQARAAFWAALRASAANGRTVVFSTHYLEEADSYAERIVVLRAGRVVADGTPEDVKAAAGIRRHIAFRCPRASAEVLSQLPAVTHVVIDHEHVTLTTTEPDTTIWALYDLRHAISEIEITGSDLQEAFLALIAEPAEASNDT